MSLRNDVLRDRYLLPGETENGMYERVAKALTRKSEETFHFERLMKEKLFFPNTPTLVNAGTPYEGGFSACYTVPVGDSLDEIFKALTDAGKIHKFFGGTGFNFSNVRPRGARINTTGGRACGPVSVLRSFNQSADMVSQGGKRQGANMGILDVDHPDLLEFIKLKEIWPDVKHFNVSVGMSDRFMEKVVTGELDDIWLINTTGYIKIGDHFVRYDPDTYVEHKKYDIVEYPMSVGDVWDQIVENAWRCGDPGLVFFDTIEKGNMCKHLGRMRATNPCLVGSALVPTSTGMKRMDKIEVGDKIWVAPDTFETVIKTWQVEEQPVFEVITERGYALRATADHKFVTDRGLIPVCELKVGDKVECQVEGYLPEPTSPDDYELGLIAGVIHGDGWCSSDRVGITFAQDDREFAEYIVTLLHKHFGVRSTIRDYTGKTYCPTERPALRVHSARKALVEFAKLAKTLEIVEGRSREFIRGFIAGWLEADGHVDRHNGMSICLSCKYKRNLEVFATLLAQFGIQVSNIYRMTHCDKSYGSDGHYKLTITGVNKKLLVDTIPMYGSIRRNLDVKEVYQTSKGVQWQKIVDIVECEPEIVYDFRTDGNKIFYANGIRTLDCGEQPLLPYESCNLGSINLSKFASEDVFDFEKFEDTIEWAVRLLDNVIDKNRYPIPEVAEATLLTRKIGLGVMGWHDCLINLGVPYCSEEALRWCDEIGRSYKMAAEDASHVLAEELGVFPAYEGSEWEKMGRPVRNATQTTIAPTGTLSSIFAECSSGIEPHFARKFTRQSEAGIGTYEVEVPEGETSMEVPYEWHIKHQARWQKWIHNAASKTINMPESASVEDVREAYIMAWEMGCKGITVYRDGSKDKQVLRAVEHVSPGVGHERFGSTLDFTTGCGSIHVTCNELERRPYEVYVLSEGGCPANNEALGKVISKYLHDPRLRGGELETVQRITRTLHKVKCMTALRSKKAAGKSCADIIASRMDKVWADENIEVVKPTCPECGRELRFGGGCGSGECVCGWSGCS